MCLYSRWSWIWTWIPGLEGASGCQEVGTGTRTLRTGRKMGEPVVGMATGLDRETTCRFKGNDVSSGETTCRWGRLPRAGAWARGQKCPMVFRRVEARVDDSSDRQTFRSFIMS